MWTCTLSQVQLDVHVLEHHLRKEEPVVDALLLQRTELAHVAEMDKAYSKRQRVLDNVVFHMDALHVRCVGEGGEQVGVRVSHLQVRSVNHLREATFYSSRPRQLFRLASWKGCEVEYQHLDETSKGDILGDLLWCQSNHNNNFDLRVHSLKGERSSLFKSKLVAHFTKTKYLRLWR